MIGFRVVKAVAQDQYMFTCGLSRLEGPGRAGTRLLQSSTWTARAESGRQKENQRRSALLTGSDFLIGGQSCGHLSF